MANEYDLDEPDAEERPEPSEDGGPAPSKYWLDLILDAQKCEEQYFAKAKKVEEAYAKLEKLANATRTREMQVFWANLEVLKPSVYARPPIPVVVPRFKDRKPLSRQAAELLERCLISASDLEHLDDLMQLVRDDLIITARGVGWARYWAGDDNGGFAERVIIDHVDREDFLHDPARKWREVEWVARRSWLDYDAMKARFTPSCGDAWKDASFQSKKGKDDSYDGPKKAAVWEIWHKSYNQVVWVSPSVEVVLDDQPPLLKLPDFFPCPRPVFGTLERGTLTPVPDYFYCADQFREINDLTEKIAALTDGLVVKGFYQGGGGDLTAAIEKVFKMQDPGQVLVPVANLGAMGASVKDAVLWLPIVEVIQTLQAAVEARKLLINDVYEITGLSDIFRGATDPNETLGAQQLKSQYGGVRVRQKQNELVRFGKEMCVLMGEIIAENFQPASMQQMAQMDDMPTRAEIQQQAQQIMQVASSQIMQAKFSPQGQQMLMQNPEQAQQMEAQAMGQAKQQADQLGQTITLDDVCELLRQQRLRPFILDIETDSTVMPDEQAAKQAVTEFGGVMATLLPQLQAMITQAPQSAEFAGDLLKFMTAPFRVGRQLEASIDNLVEMSKQAAQQPPKPTPEEQKVQGEMAVKKAELEGKSALNQQQMEMQREKHQMEMQKLGLDMQAKTEERQFQQEDRGFQRQDRDEERAVKGEDREFQREERDFKREDRQFAREDRDEDRGMKREQHDQVLQKSKADRDGVRASQGLPPEDHAQAALDEIKSSRETTSAIMEKVTRALEMVADAVAAEKETTLVLGANGRPQGSVTRRKS